MTSESLVIAVGQPHSVAHDVAANAAAHAEIVRAAHARVVVFPELSLTGYELDATPVDVADPRLSPVVDACGLTAAIALVGAPVDGRHIAVLAIDGDGARVAYRKINVATSESGHFMAGDAPAVIEVDGWRIGLAICRDTGIVEHSAATAALGVDVYVAGLADEVHEIAVHDERAARVVREHGVAVAFANADGRSRIWDANGVVVADAGPNIGAFAVATLTR